jgi:hypothetical protein
MARRLVSSLVSPTVCADVTLLRMSHDDRTIDWVRVVVHASIGLILGALLGLSFAAFADGAFSWCPVLLGGAIFAVLGGVFGDRFWEQLGSLLSWFWWW